MKIGLIFISFVLFSTMGNGMREWWGINDVGKGGSHWQGFDKGGYFAVMASGNITALDSILSLLQQGTLKEKEGYEGALLMRKAGLLRRPKEKRKN
jgi:hypothetical protein